jgi:hypothetical protein
MFGNPMFTAQQQAQKQQMPMHLQGQALQGAQHQQLMQQQLQQQQQQQQQIGQPPQQQLGQQQQLQQSAQTMNGGPGAHMPIGVPAVPTAKGRKAQGSQPSSAQSSPSPANASLPVNHNVTPNLTIDYTTISGDEFEDQLREFMKARNTPLPTKIPSMGSKKINLLLLFRISMSMGGMESVSEVSKDSSSF